MLQFKIKEKIESRGIFTPFTWMVKHCHIPPASANKLLNGKQKSLNLMHLSKLCENLHCTPNELIYWQQTPANALLPTHPCITDLAVPPTHSSIKNLLKSMTAEEMKVFYSELLAANEAKEKK
jgi:DNA-binding Xre family transcriptional regulator